VFNSRGERFEARNAARSVLKYASTADRRVESRSRLLNTL
jgi:hypothetical protein